MRGSFCAMGCGRGYGRELIEATGRSTQEGRGASRLACCAGKRCAFPQLRTLPGSNPGVWVAKSPLPGG